MPYAFSNSQSAIRNPKSRISLRRTYLRKHLKNASHRCFYAEEDPPFDVAYLVSLTFFAASGYPATAGLIIAHLGNQMGRTSFF